jgi:lipopolysaccharide export system protein LptC
MRPLILSVAGGLALAGIAWAQSSGNNSGVSQLPVGQLYKDFQFPYYEDGVLKFTLTADEAKGITVNRAETTDLKIDIYDNGKVTTTITSPKADLYVADRKMRTHDTVQITRADLDATAQFCDFDLAEKQYTLRNNVKVTIKNFDAGNSVPKSAAASGPAPLQPAPVPAESTDKDAMLLTSPGAFSSTNAPSSSP